MSLPLASDPAASAQAPQSSVTLTPELRAELDALVKDNDLVLFMKGTPDAPQCGFSNRAAQVYTATGQPFKAVNVFAGSDPMGYVRALAEWADWPTLPQCWVKGELIGGSDIAAEMLENGELAQMLAE